RRVLLVPATAVTSTGDLHAVRRRTASGDLHTIVRLGPTVDDRSRWWPGWCAGTASCSRPTRGRTDGHRRSGCGGVAAFEADAAGDHRLARRRRPRDR